MRGSYLPETGVPVVSTRCSFLLANEVVIFCSEFDGSTDGWVHDIMRESKSRAFILAGARTQKVIDKPNAG